MSAIFGICNGQNKLLEATNMQLMLSELNHWDADKSNVWLDNEIGLGSLLLYNTPESLQEHLPYYDTLSNLTITADARIDNREELFSVLAIPPRQGVSVSDSELILCAYQKFGNDCIQYLIGDFSFAIWDGNKKQLFCARDHMGVRPFFYYHRDNIFLFATEKKGILVFPFTDKTLNKQYFYNQIYRQRIQASDTTLYTYIKKLSPGHFLTFNSNCGELKVARYWNLDAEKELKLANKSDYYEGLKFHFETAIKCRIRTNYPIGIELSGGMDSSSIAGVVRHYLKGTDHQIFAFTNADNESSLSHSEKRGGSDVRLAEEVMRFNQLEDLIYIRNSISEDPLEVFSLISKMQDGLERWNLAWQLPIKQDAFKKNVRTMFSGFPGDEMVTCRGDYSYLDLLDQKRYLDYLRAKPKFPFRKHKPFLGPYLEYILHKFRNLVTINEKEIRQLNTLFPIPFKFRFNRGDVAWQDINFRERFKSYRHFQRYRLLKPQISLRLETETNFGRWLRHEPSFPMADIRLTQFYLSMPNPIKYQGDVTRDAWRNAIKNYLPETILKRDTKVGMMIPYIHDPDRLQTYVSTFKNLINKSRRLNSNEKNRILIELKNDKTLLRCLDLFLWFENNFENL